MPAAKSRTAAKASERKTAWPDCEILGVVVGAVDEP